MANEMKSQYFHGFPEEIEVLLPELQFGIIRALGLSRRNVTSMLVWEQILLIGTAIVLGLLIGSIAGYLYIPFLELVYGVTEQVPPLKVLALRRDFVKVYFISGFMLLAGIFLFWYFVSGLRIHKAIKLGED